MNKFPYLKFLKISKECREELIKDTLKDNSPDLYDALYSSIDSEIYNVKIELYELKWIELYWDKLIDGVESKDISVSEKKELISMLAKWYIRFVANWNYSDFDTLIFEEKKNILRRMISVNNEWEQSIKQMKVSFEKSKKRLNARIKELELGE